MIPLPGIFKSLKNSSKNSSKKTIRLILVSIGFIPVLLFFTNATLNSGTVITPEQFGAKADGVTDSTAAFQAAIAAAVASNGAIQDIQLASGTYLWKCSSLPGVTPLQSLPWPIPRGAVANAQPEVRCLNMSGAKQLRIKGQGLNQTQILIENPVAGLLTVQSSSGVTLSSFSIDHTVLPFTQGTVRLVNSANNSLEVALEAGYPSLDQVIFSKDYFPQSFAMIMEPSVPRLKQTTKGYFPNLTFSKNPTGTWNVFLDPADKWIFSYYTPNGGIASGDRFVLPVRVSTSLVFYRSSNLTLQNVAVYSGPGAATIFAENSGKIVVDGFQVRRKPGTNRLVSTAADALYMPNNTAKILVQNSYIEGMGDDALNIFDRLPSISSVNANGVFSIGTFSNLFNLWQSVQISNPLVKKIKGSGKIVFFRGSQASGVSSIGIDRSVGVAVGDNVFSEELASPGALITKNTFSNFRGIVRLRSPGAVFSNNVFLDSVNAQVLVDSDSFYNEGPSLLYNPNKMITVYGNTVQNGSLVLIDINYQPISTALQNRSIFLNEQLFDVRIYRALNPDLNAYSDSEITAHWLNHGISEGRQASLTFYSREYLSLYPDLVNAFGSTGYSNAALHFLLGGNMIENRVGSIITNPLIFDTNVYRVLNTDLSYMNDAQILLHWVNHGLSEGRRASFIFSSRDYLSLYSDLAAGFGTTGYFNAVKHFLTNGFSLEKRAGTINTNALVYNSDDYRYYNSDLSTWSNNDVMWHWITNGIAEGRRARSSFSSRIYLQRYPDIAGANSTNYLAAIYHYVLHGYAEGRSGQ